MAGRICPRGVGANSAAGDENPHSVVYRIRAGSNIVHRSKKLCHTGCFSR
jgi:hypothetical protein